MERYWLLGLRILLALLALMMADTALHRDGTQRDRYLSFLLLTAGIALRIGSAGLEFTDGAAKVFAAGSCLLLTGIWAVGRRKLQAKENLVLLSLAAFSPPLFRQHVGALRGLSTDGRAGSLLQSLRWLNDWMGIVLAVLLLTIGGMYLVQRTLFLKSRLVRSVLLYRLTFWFCLSAVLAYGIV